jgi:hypothetical protein
MAGAPAGPALDPERPADRLEAVRETDESRPVRRARRAQPQAGSARPPRASPPRPGCSPETLGRNLRATAVARTPELDRRLAVLAEDNERCSSSRAALACVARLVDVRREPRGDRARGRRMLAGPLTITSAHGRARTAARATASGVVPAARARRLEGGSGLAAGEPAVGQRLLDADPQSPGVRARRARAPGCARGGSRSPGPRRTETARARAGASPAGPGRGP